MERNLTISLIQKNRLKSIIGLLKWNLPHSGVSYDDFDGSARVEDVG